MPKYKQGKQQNLLDFHEFSDQVEKARLNTEHSAFIWLLYYSGCRKSEAYERTIQDVEVSPTHFTIDFHQRKKGGAAVDPLSFPRSWKGIEQLIKLYERARQRKPNRKRIFYSEDKQRRSRIEKAQWLFPNIQSHTAWRIVKRVLGFQFYPHFLRLNRITELAADPKMSLLRLKSYTGLKSLDALQAYMGISKKEQEAALSWMEKKMKG